MALFNVNSETSIPTWFAQSLLLGAAGILLFIAFVSKARCIMWASLGAIFTYVSIDEGAAIHELTVRPIRNIFDIHAGLFYYSWVLLFASALMVLVIVYARFWWHLPSMTKYLFLAAFLIFVSGGIGLEMLGGQIAAVQGETALTYGLLVAGEEFLEMLGVIVFIYALLAYVKQQKPEIAIT